MKFLIYDLKKYYYHQYWKFIISDKLIPVDEIEDCNDMNIIFIASEASELFYLGRILNSNNIILVIEDPCLKKKVSLAKNIKFDSLNNVLKQISTV